MMITSIFIKTKTQLLILGFVLFFSNTAFSQTNLVPNPSFEQYTICPYNRTYLEQLNGKPDFWFKPDHRYAGSFNACANDSIYGGVPNQVLAGGKGYQVAKSGNAYIGLYYFGPVLHYFEIKLYDSLKAHKKYYGEYFTNLTNNSRLACNNQNMFFSKHAVFVDTANYDTMLRNPQVYNFDNPIIADTLNWVKVSGVFTAQGGEQYLTLGNFKNIYNNTKRIIFQNTGVGGAYYVCDDVAVYALDSFCLKADAGKDTTINAGDTVYIGTYTNGIDSLRWLQNSIVIDTLKPGFLVHPTTTTSYILQQTVNGCFSSDTVTVTVKPLPLKFLKYEVRSTNENGGSIPLLGGVRGGLVQNTWQTANEINVSHFNIQRSVNGKDFTIIGKIAAQNKITNEYNFADELTPKDQDLKSLYYRIESVDFDGRKQYSTIQQINTKLQTPNIVLFPNPAKDNVTIECKGAKELMIIDDLGRVVTDKKIINNQLTIINVQGFSKGIYIVKAIMNNGEIKTEKLIVQ